MAVTYVATGLGAGGNSSFNSAMRASAPMAIVLEGSAQAVDPPVGRDLRMSRFMIPTLTADRGQINSAGGLRSSGGPRPGFTDKPAR